jgi:hypothetical protein
MSTPIPSTPLTPEQMARLQQRLADRAAVADIQTQAVRIQQPGGPWYDVRPMIDRHEHDAVSIDMAREAIDYALQRRLAVRHPEQPLVLRITGLGLWF